MKTRDGSLCLRPRLVAMSRLLPTDAPVSTPRFLRFHRQESLETFRLDCRQAHHLQGNVVALFLLAVAVILRVISLGLDGDSGPSRRELRRAPRQHHDLTILMSCRQRAPSGGGAPATDWHAST
jgi:hypothetical protein